jgi:hypothetical protein
MIARAWHGRVPESKSESYYANLLRTGIADYASTPANRGVWVLRRTSGSRAMIARTNVLTATRICVAIILIAGAVACHPGEAKRADTTRADTTRADTTRADSPRADSSVAVAPIARADSVRARAPQFIDSNAAAAHHTKPSAWAVTDSGAGVLRIGMTRDQLALDLHATPPKHTRADSGCAYLAVAGIPAGMRTMWVAATLARIDIGAPKLATDRGAKIGDKAAKIESLYRGRVTTMPAKYDPRGKYLVIHPPPFADSTRRIVFETDSTTRVTRYRVGREPEVEWVEGCS